MRAMAGMDPRTVPPERDLAALWNDMQAARRDE